MKRYTDRLSFQPILNTVATGTGALLMLAAGQCLAGDIYRWVDEQGHTHLSDAVPERYKAKATKIDSRRFEVSERDAQEAAARAAKERQRQAALEAERAQAAQRPASESGIFSAPPGKAADKAPATQCDRLWQEYFKSQECFAPYFTRNGIKAEAFEHCKEVVSPDQQCGPAKKIGTD